MLIKIKNQAIRGGWGSVARDNVQVEGVELIRCVNVCVTSLGTGPAYVMKCNKCACVIVVK